MDPLEECFREFEDLVAPETPPEDVVAAKTVPEEIALAVEGTPAGKDCATNPIGFSGVSSATGILPISARTLSKVRRFSQVLLS